MDIRKDVAIVGPFVFADMFSKPFLIVSLLVLGIVILKSAIIFLEGRSLRHCAYTKKDSLLTDAEKCFYAALKEAVGSDWIIFSQVSLLEILSISETKNTRSYITALNRIRAKHVDFLLCEKETTKPLLVIELDDSSHRWPSRILRDAFVDKAFASTGLPILHVKAAASYDSDALRQQFSSMIG